MSVSFNAGAVLGGQESAEIQAQIAANADNAKLRFILTSTWATLPAPASVPVDARYYVSDIGINGSDWYTDGTRWRLVNGRVVLAMSNTASVVTGTLGATAATVTIPAGVMGTSGALEVSSLWSCNENANPKSCNINFSIWRQMSCSLTDFLSSQMLTNICNRTATSQIGGTESTGFVYGALGAPHAVSLVNTAIAQDVTFNAVHSITSDTITLESYRITLIA